MRCKLNLFVDVQIILKRIVEELKFPSPSTTITISNLECVISSQKKYIVY